MEKIVSKQIQTVVWIVFFAFLVTLPLVPPAAAEEASQLSEDKAEEFEGLIERGAQYLEQGKYRKAIGEFNRALLLDPASERAKRGIIKANQGIAARSAAPDVSSIEQDRLSFHLAKGTEYYDAEKYDEAMAEWEQVLQIDPENKLARSLIDSAKRAKVDLLIEKGHDEFFKGNFDEAIAIWEEAYAIVPTSKVLENLLAEANVVRHTREKERLDADNAIQLQHMREAIRKKSLLAPEMDVDGVKRMDRSLKPPPHKPKQFGAREVIRKELSQLVTFDFECERLRNVLKFLTEITGINILTDEDVFEQFGKEEDCFGNEVEQKEIFITINVIELPLESALNGMLRQHGLGFSIERDFIYVSTPDVLRGSSFEQLETRFYHIRDTSRVILPKVDTSGTTGGVTLGGRDLNLASGASLLSRLTTVTEDTIQEVEPDFVSMTVPKLVNIIRSFIPAVLDPTRQTTGARTTVIGEDRAYGGLRKGSDQLLLFDAKRMIRADSSGREILSLVDFDPHTNTLIVRNTPTNLDMVEVFLDHLDLEPRQVSVEAMFITYSLVEAERVGVDFTFGTPLSPWNFGAGALADGGNVDFSFGTNIDEGITGGTDIGSTTGGNLFFRFSKADGDFLEATINLLSELKNTQVVSAPRLVTLHNKPAVIQNVETRSFRSDLTIETTLVGQAATDVLTPVQTVDQEFTDVTEGITLSVTPQIQQNDTIRLFILPDIAEIVGDPDEFVVTTGSANEPVENVVTRPRVARQSILTNLVVNDGDTIVIGGLINNDVRYEKTGVPFFRDIPLAGRLFENETAIEIQTNLLIFITVNIMDSRGVAYTRLK